MRRALKDITLRDGTRVPAGTLLSVVSHEMHRDGADGAAFDPFRFARMRAGAGAGAGGDLKHQLVSTSADYLAFGLGRHAWCVPLPCSRARF